MTLIISAFPGTGKTYLKEFRPDLTIWDSDSSSFSKLPDFPQNYVDHIKKGIELNADIILVSSHENVRKALFDNEIPFITIVPELEQKDDYIQRYKNRGSSREFIDLISNNWELWLGGMYWKNNVYLLFKGEYLSDIIDQLISNFTLTKQELTEYYGVYNDEEIDRID